MQQSSHDTGEKIRGNGKAKNADEEENDQKGSLKDASAAHETPSQCLAAILHSPLPKPSSKKEEPARQQSI